MCPQTHFLGENWLVGLNKCVNLQVQLGGYDPKSTSGPMNYVPSLTHEDFSVPVTSLMYGKGGTMKELLNFKSSGDYLPAIMDSGTSCLVIPAGVKWTCLSAFLHVSKLCNLAFFFQTRFTASSRINPGTISWTSGRKTPTFT